MLSFDLFNKFGNIKLMLKYLNNQAAPMAGLLRVIGSVSWGAPMYNCRVS